MTVVALGFVCASIELVVGVPVLIVADEVRVDKVSFFAHDNISILRARDLGQRAIVVPVVFHCVGSPEVTDGNVLRSTAAVFKAFFRDSHGTEEKSSPAVSVISRKISCGFKSLRGSGIIHLEKHGIDKVFVFRRRYLCFSIVSDDLKLSIVKFAVNLMLGRHDDAYLCGGELLFAVVMGIMGNRSSSPRPVEIQRGWVLGQVGVSCNNGAFGGLTDLN